MPARPGRPRSEASRQSLINATLQLMSRKSVRHITISAIAEEAGVAKSTIYRWWDSKCAIVMDAFFSTMKPCISLQEDGPVTLGLSTQIREMVELLSGPSGKVIAEMVGEGQSDPHILEEFRSRIFTQLLEPSRQLIERGKRDGEISEQLQTDLVLDMIFGPLYHRLLFGHRELDDAFSESLTSMITIALTPRKS
ncbi:TetR/AcrR family transcriptional regulator [Ruegeria atlantica]|uniref:TetR/AcrR family transcriptional regulator n=1 Tax=Ruegeria atlantica TaxID=81569 RepID=UPI0034A04A83